MKWSRVLSLVLVLAVVLPFATGAKAEEVLLYENRKDIPLKYLWKLDDIFASRADFERAFEEADAMIPEAEGFRGRLGESPETLAKALENVTELIKLIQELAVYAGQNRDIQSADADAIELNNRVQALAARAYQSVSYVDPEIALIPDEKLAEYRKDPRVHAFDHNIDDVVRQKPHIRSAEVEEVLASAALMAQAPQDAYNTMVDADIEWPKIKNEKGEEVTVTPALYYSFLNNQNRDVRRDAGLALFRKYGEFGNTFAATYSGHVQRDLFFARNRGFDKALDATLFEMNIPPEVIETLVKTVHENYPLLHRYASLRKEILGVDEFHVYDLYVGLVPELDKKITFEEGYAMALDFWKKTFGEEYAAVGKKAFDERWIDVYASKGKRGGAYSWGSYESHPYLLLNWGGTLEDVFTLVHEMGHSIHTYMTTENQPFQYSDYPSFVAEVASVASEALFLDYMLERAESDLERLSLLDLYMNNITGTFVRQIFFHEFEATAHTMAENGEALTKESLNEVHGNLWKNYYGPDLTLDDEFKADWCRIPHFYRTFYVWSYATSFAAGEAIAQRLRSGEPSAVADYLAMLKLGGSVYPMECLQRAGVDMTDPKVIQTVMKRYEQTLDEMGALLRAQKKARG